MAMTKNFRGREASISVQRKFDDERVKGFLLLSIDETDGIERDK